MSISSFDRAMFRQAYIEASKSTFNRFRVGCVIAYKKHIIGRGHNSDKTNPMQKEYNIRYRHFNNGDGSAVKHSVHAEISAIQSVSYIVGKDIDWSQTKVYVYRICPGKRLGYGCARPCIACENALRDLGVKHIFYTDNCGLSYTELQ